MFRPRLLIVLAAIATLLAACSSPGGENAPPPAAPSAEQTFPSPTQVENPGPAAPSPLPALPSVPAESPAPPPPPGERIQPEDIVYLGAFRLPEASGGSSWEYSGQGLTYDPQGDPAGAE
ncbi:MAG TPA: hypothetical protein ENJ02_06550, partial [Chloroflexi bacterium]|nr:hypothetical protein [Chloroflexota bacterium]